MAQNKYGVALGVALDGENKNNIHAPDINRYLGGATRTVDSHPYVKGYFYVFFGFPPGLFADGSNATVSASMAQTYTLSAAEGFTPPGDRQLKTEDVMGMGGVDASFITGQTIDRNFSIQYRDYWGSPIFRIHRQWTGFLNPYYGGATGTTNINLDFAASDYKGTCMIIQTKPVTKLTSATWTKKDIIKVDYFDGVIPITDLKSAYDSNITDNSIAKPTVQYRFDGFPLDETNPDVLDKAYNILSNIQYDSYNSSAMIYNDLIDNTWADGNLHQVSNI
jgi:hypothetical protein